MPHASSTSSAAAPMPAADWRAPELCVVVPSFNERANIAPLYDKLAVALEGIAWEMIVVDDDSPDGTATEVALLSRERPNLRGLRRIGRRGLSSACIEGMAATAAPYVAVIDADHQHDERVLPRLLQRAREGDDIVVGSRYMAGGATGEGFTEGRARVSRLATRLSRLVTGEALSDPMSGFFLLRRDLFDEVAPTLSRDGFKILLDIIVSATRFRARQGAPVRIGEVAYTFRPRHAGESKMSPLIAVQFAGLILSKLSRGLFPTSFLLFAMVGVSGLFVHMGMLWLARYGLNFNFTNSQLTATVVAMTTNFILNNELTYADKKLRGWRYWRGLLSFYAVCSIGALANVSVAAWIYQARPDLFLAGFTGAMMSVVFNYSVTRVFTWR